MQSIRVLFAFVVLAAAGATAWFLTREEPAGAAPAAASAATETAPSTPPAAAPSGPDLPAAPAAAAPDAVSPTRAEAAPAAAAAASDDKASSKLATVAGRVIDEAGRPIADAPVAVQSVYQVGFGETAVRQQTRTGADGRFQLEHVAASSNLKVVVRPREHCDVEKVLSDPTGPTLAVGDLVAALGGSVTGRVQDEHGSAVPGALVRAWHDQKTSGTPGMLVFGALGMEGARSTKTDERGFWRIDGLPAGEATALAEADGYTKGVTKSIAVQKSGIANDVVVTVSSGRAISGVVVDAAGTSLPGAEVHFTETVIDLGSAGFSGEFGKERKVAADANGYFEIRGLKDGEYRLTAKSKGHLSASTGAIVAGATDVRIALPQSGILYGVAKDRDSAAPVALRQVSVQGEGRFGPSFDIGGETAPVLYGADAASAAGVPEEDGLYAIVDLPGTAVTMTAEVDGYAPYDSGTINVAPGERRRLDPELVPELTIAGIVLDARGNPIENATVRLEKAAEDLSGGGSFRMRAVRVSHGADGEADLHTDADPALATTDVGGRFLLKKLSPGKFTLAARHSEWAPSEPLNLTLEDGTPIDDAELTLRSGGALTGTAYDADGNPIAKATVTLRPEKRGGSGGMQIGGKNIELPPLDFGGGEDAPTAVSDESGKYEIRGILPGRYLARLRSADRVQPGAGGVFFAIAGGGRGEGGTPITIEEGETAELDLALAPTGSVKGRVTEAGTPLANVPVSLVKGDLPLPFGGQNATTDENGAFEVTDVEPGDYQLIVSPKGAADPIKKRAAVKARQAELVDVQLPTGVLAGRVIDVDSGRPLAGVTVEVSPADDGKEGGEPRVQQRMMFVATVGSGGGGATTMKFGNEDDVVRTDSEGRYEVRYLATGDYEVAIRGAGVVKQQKDRVKVQEGQRTDNVSFEAAVGVVLTVKVEFPRGSDAGEQEFRFIRATLTAEADPGNADTRAEAGGGPVTFEGLGPGTYTVEIQAGDLSGEETFEIESGKDLTVTVPVS